MGNRSARCGAREKGAPVTVETIVVPDPGPGEAVVAVKACGVCHTDLHYREGGINDDFPFLLGHEAAGVVEAVGPGVTDLAPGDFVVLNWRAVCGECRSCRRGRPWYCFATHNATQKMTLADGTPLSPALGIGAFAERDAGGGGPVHQGQPGRPARGGRAARVRRDGGHRRGHVHRGRSGPGDSVAVFGCGGVGCAAVAGSKLAGAATIIAVDLDPGKLELATVVRRHAHRRRQHAPTRWRRSRALTGGNGADVCIEAVGHPAVMEQAFMARDLAGTLVQVGVPTPDMRIDLPMIEFFGRGGALKPSWYGDCLPSRDFPMLVDLYLDGRLDLDRFVSETIGIDEVEAAFARMQRGEVLRSVVVALSRERSPSPPSAPRTGLRGMVAAADQLAASAGIGHAGPGRLGGRRRGGHRHGRWRSSARTCAGSGATSWPWWRAPGSPPEALLSIGRAGARVRPGPDARRGHGDDAAAGRHPQRARCPAPSTAGSRCTSATGGCPSTTSWRRRSSWRRTASPASIMLALASHLVHALPGAGELCPDGPLEIGQTRARARHRPHPARHRPATAATASTRASSDGACSSSAAATSRPADFATSAATWCAPLRLQRLGPRPVDRAAPVAGLPHAGRRRGRRGGRARHRPRRSAVGPSPRRDVARRRPRPPRRSSSTAPTAPRSSTRRGWPPRRPRVRRTPWRRPTSRPAAARRAPTWPASATGTPRTCAPWTPTGSGSR